MKDQEGWGGFPAPAEFRASGGNGGGFLFVDNPETDPQEVSFPSYFRGNLLPYNGGRLRFDGNVLQALDRYWAEGEGRNYGTITIQGGGASVSKDFVPGQPPTGTWVRYQIPFTAAAFGTSEQTWTTILSNVTGITLSVEVIFGREQEGIDNVYLVPPNNPALTITTTSLPRGEVGKPYEARLDAAGGTPPYFWSAGLRPPGLFVDPNLPFLIGTPERAGTYEMILRVADADGTEVSKTITVAIDPSSSPVTIVTNSLASAMAGTPYSRTLLATGGAPPYTWEWTANVAGLQLDPRSGTISGTPSAAVYQSSIEIDVTVTVRDSAGATAQRQLTLGIGVTPEIMRPFDGVLTQGQVGVAYDYGLWARKGQPPYEWDRVGTLPPGLTIDQATGRITGTPTTPGTYDFRVHVYDKFRSEDEKACRIVISATQVSGVKLSGNEFFCSAVQGGGLAPSGTISVSGGDTADQRTASVDASRTASWAQIVDTSGQLASNNLATPRVLRAACNPAGLAPGVFRTEWKIGGQSVFVNMDIRSLRPRVQASPSVVEFHASSAALSTFRDVVVRVDGDVRGDRPVSATSSLNSITVNDRNARVSVGTPLVLQAEHKYDRGALPLETGKLTVQAGRLPPLDLGLRVFKAEQFLRVFPGALRFDAYTAPDTRKLYLTNPSDTGVDWSSSVDDPTGSGVIRLNPASGTVVARAASEIEVLRGPGPSLGAANNGVIHIITRRQTVQVPIHVTVPSPPGTLSPSALVFRPGGDPLSLALLNVRNVATPFSCSASPSAITVTPASGTLNPLSSTGLRVTATFSGQGIQRGTVTCSAGGAVSTATVVGIPQQASCTPAQHIPVLENLNQNFLITGYLPRLLNVRVYDNCGSRVNDAFVALTRDNSSEYVTFRSMGDGLYSGSWFAKEGPFAGSIYSGTAPAAEPGPRKGPAAEGDPQVLTGQMLVTGTVSAPLPGTPVLHEDSPFRLVDGANPLPAGQVGILLATGLGDVDPPLGEDEQTASGIRRTAAAVKVRVGGQPAQVLFAGLLPGFAGVYQVNFLPAQEVTGGAVTVELEVAGQLSNLVTTVIR